MTGNGALTLAKTSNRERIPITQDPKGFSLVELLVVIVIIGVIAAIGTPRLLAMRPKASVRADAKDFYSAIRTAQTEAVKRSENVCVQITSSTGYRVYLDDSGDNLVAEELRAGNSFTNALTPVPDTTPFDPPPCYDFRGLPSNNDIESVDIQNNTLRMRVELTVAGHVRSDVSPDW